jgi:hypothetical protein
MISLAYSHEEENWLKQQFDLIEGAFRSVSVGEQMTKEFMMYSVGIPLPQGKVQSTIRSCYFSL